MEGALTFYFFRPFRGDTAILWPCLRRCTRGMVAGLRMGGSKAPDDRLLTVSRALTVTDSVIDGFVCRSGRTISHVQASVRNSSSSAAIAVARQLIGETSRSLYGDVPSH